MVTSSTESFDSKTPQSPCIDLCTLDDRDICVGCFRSIDEICAWGAAGDDQRRSILKAAADRRSGKNGHA